MQDHLQQVEVWPARREAPGPDGTLGGMGLCPIAAEEKPEVEELTDVAFPQLVQEQVAAADVALLRSGEDRDDEASQMQTLNWSPDRRPYVSYSFSSAAMGSRMLFPGGLERGAAGLAVSERLRIGVLDRLESGRGR